MAEEQTTKSRQPRFDVEARHSRAIWQYLLERWTKDMLKRVPDYTPDSRALDKWLSDFWRTEPLLAGVVNSVVNIDKNRGWTLTGGRNQVGRFQRVLREAEDGAGWRRFIGLQSEAYWTTNIGALAEIARVGDNGPLGALYHLDSTRCMLTGDPGAPLRYEPVAGKPQSWRATDYMRAVSMPMPQEEYHQLGYCAVMRAAQLAILMVAIYRHDREMLFAAMPKGLLLLTGIDEQDWETAMQANTERLTAKEREFYSGLSIFFSRLGGDLDAKLVALSQLPEGFSMTEWTNLLMYGYALAFGYDPREFWPVSGGQLGTGRESELQALKASGKGGLDFALSFQDNLQRELPATLLFEFDQRDTAGELEGYQAIRAYADAVNAMAQPAGPGYEETLTAEQRRRLFAEKGLIPDEWTVAEEQITLTDTGTTERDRLLAQPQILRACERFQDEPIVRLTWDWRRGEQLRTLWPSGAQALQPPATYSLPARPRVVRRAAAPESPEPAVLYASEDGDVVITEADVDRAIGPWDARVDPAYRGLLEAHAVGPEVEE